MKKIFFLLCMLLVSTFVIPQTKYLIYFKDKGIAPSNILQKSSALYKQAEKELTAKAIERRKQVMGEDNYITYEDLPLSDNYIRQVEGLGIKIENKLKWFNAVSSYLTNEQLSKIKKMSFVEKVEIVHVFKSPNDENAIEKNDKTFKAINSIQSSLGLNYGPSLTQNALSDIPAVHDLGIKGTDVLVGILDSGFRWKNNPALKNLKVLYEYDYVQKDNVTENQTSAENSVGQDSHGTAVFSILAGYDPGQLIGPGYDASFLLAKTEDISSEKHIEEDNYAAALQDFEARGVHITTSSLGYNQFDSGQGDYTFTDMNGNFTIVTKAANLAFQRGVSTFTSAGNERGNSWNHIIAPADALDIIAVGAVTSSNTIASFSSPGPTYDGRIKPEIAAMGSSVYHSNPGGSYSIGAGTSYSAPIAAGVAALLKSCWPHLTNVQLRKIFLASGDNTNSPNNDRGWGLISVRKAVSYPNLSATNNVYKVLNKIFIDANGVNSSTVKLNYKIGNSSFQTVTMNYDGTLKYNYTLPSGNNGDVIEFNFIYQTTGGTSVREPVGTNNYKFSFGSNDIGILTSIKKENELPAQFYLSQNYPNPFNPETTISYQLSTVSKVSLKVYDLLGREVATLVNEVQQPGVYNSQFSILHSQLTSGVYFYRLQAGEFSETKKMVLIK